MVLWHHKTRRDIFVAGSTRNAKHVRDVGLVRRRDGWNFMGRDHRLDAAEMAAGGTECRDHLDPAKPAWVDRHWA